MDIPSSRPCPFCGLGDQAIWLSNDHALAFRDKFPVSGGHTLVIPRRHVASLFDLPPEEQRAAWSLVAEVRDRLRRDLRPDGFNIGLNDGAAAGQTVPHAHIHVIPRFAGDVPDPRGGVRWIIPAKAKYWT